MRILFIGNLFHDYELDMRDGLEALGHTVDMRFNNIHGPFQIQDVKTIPNWIKYGVMPYKLKINYFMRRSIDRYNQDVMALMQKNKYDLLIDIGAKTIYPETIAAFKGRKLFWFLDALPRYQFVMPKLHLFDDLFVFEPTDRAYIKEQLGFDSTYLTTGLGPKRYFQQSLPVAQDFSFVGSFYPKREEYLHALLGVSDSLVICGDFYRTRYKALKAKMWKVNVPASIANDLYGSSRINVNIHHSQSVEGVSIRTFDILGAGGFEIVERQKGILQYFEEGRHMAFYDSKEEFLDKCGYYLRHETERLKIAAAGHELVMKEHTWASRFREMFRIAGLSA